MEGLAALDRRLRRALTEGTLILRYQPVVALATGTVDELRAVLRWPGGGGVTPQQLIAIARYARVLDALHAWILRTACNEAVRWHADGVAASAGVTLGVDQLIAGTAAHDVALALTSSGLPPASLSIGIPVAAVRSHAHHSRRALMELAALGVSSGIVGIRSWPLTDSVPRSSIDWLGIDRSLVRLLAELPPPRSTVAAVAAVVGEHRTRTVAVGVETDRELDCIWALGISHAQGYRFAPPTTATELGGLLTRMGAAGARPRRDEGTTP